MKKFQSEKAAKQAQERMTRKMYNRKIRLQFGDQLVMLDWSDLVELTGCSRSTAYRWIESPGTIPAGMVDLIRFKRLGAVPGWGHGWVVDSDGVRLPCGRSMTPADIENAALNAQLVRLMQQEIETLSQEVARLHGMLGIPGTVRDLILPPKNPVLRLAYERAASE